MPPRPSSATTRYRPAAIDPGANRCGTGMPGVAADGEFDWRVAATG
jgi:hypothetical protein